MTPIESNRIIAQFMEWEIEPGMENEKDPYYNKPATWSMIMLSEMKFSTSWDWLMPVVIKIEHIKGSLVIFYQTGCEILMFGKIVASATDDTKIQAVYTAVVQFINWYKTQTPKHTTP